MSASGGGVGFVIGLTIAQVIDHFVRGAEGGAKAIALVLNVGVAGVFALFGLLACKRQSWAFIVGMVLYGIDGVLSLLASRWLGVAFHAWVLFSLFVGLRAVLKFNARRGNNGVGG